MKHDCYSHAGHRMAITGSRPIMAVASTALHVSGVWYDDPYHQTHPDHPTLSTIVDTVSGLLNEFAVRIPPLHLSPYRTHD
jgi:hypothetical protein